MADGTTYRFREERSTLDLLKLLILLAALAYLAVAFDGRFRLASVCGAIAALVTLVFGPRLQGTTLMRLFRSADLSQVPTTIGKSWLGNVILKAEGIGKPTILPIFSRASKPYFRGQDYAVLISALQRNPQNADLVQWITLLVGAESNEARAQMAATLPTVSLRRQK